MLGRDCLRALFRKQYPQLSDPNRSDFESQIASDYNRNSKKITATPKTLVKLRFHCNFCGQNLRHRNSDWQSLAICDCDCMGHKDPTIAIESDVWHSSKRTPPSQPQKKNKSEQGKAEGRPSKDKKSTELMLGRDCVRPFLENTIHLPETG